MNCIETENLIYQFSSSEIILKGIDLKVPTGSIYGFLGPNGAGKTTTLRLLLGLLKKQKGAIKIFDKTLESNRIDVLAKTGSLIETPSLYGHLTALENLQVLQKIYRCSNERLTEVLTLVGLSDTGKKKASQFSLGMKQRLSIAIALLNNPTLLILDEPTNGLDPYGIIEVRELLKKLNREEGITIVISSHLLSEIEKLVTHLGIINHGELLFQGTFEELTNLQEQTSFITIDTNNNPKAIEILGTLGVNAVLKENKINLPILPKEKIASINKHLMSNEIEVFEISISKKDLETLFMNLINK